MLQKKEDEICTVICEVAATVEDHDSNLHGMLQRQSKKDHIKKRTNASYLQLKYLGEIDSAEDIKAIFAKVTAITDMRPPKNHAELEKIWEIVRSLDAPKERLKNFSGICQQEFAFTKMTQLLASVGMVLNITLQYKEVTRQVCANLELSYCSKGSHWFTCTTLSSKEISYIVKEVRAHV